MTITPSRRQFMKAGAIGLSLGAVLPSTAAVPGYPSKPLRMVVGFAPGGGNDALARIISQKLSISLGKPVVVDNRPGAAGTIGANVVAKAEPDGHTLLLGSVSNLVIGDAIPANTTYQTGSITLQSGAITDATDADAGEFTGSAVNVRLGTVAGGNTRTVTFRVRIH